MKTIVTAKTMDHSTGIAQTRHMSIDDGWITETFNQLPPNHLSEYKHIDYSNQYIYPGFNDTHMHLVGYGMYLSQLMLDGTESIIDLQKSLQEYAQHHTKGIIIGRNWNQDSFSEKRLPSRYDLDAICPDIPVVLFRVCGHIAVINSAAIKHFNLSPNSTISGGACDVANGELTGILRENALSFVKRDLTLDEVESYILAAQHQLNRYGITSVQTDDLITVPIEAHQDLINRFLEMSESGKLSVRVYEQSQFFTPDNFRKMIKNGYKQNAGNLFYKNGPVKILADGSLGARTAKLRDAYKDDPEASGILIHTESELKELMAIAYQNEVDIAIHGIGDYTIAFAIKTMDALQKEYPSRKHRNAIVHCQIMDEPLMDAMKTSNIYALVQPVFLEYDMTIVEQRIGNKLARTSYAYKSMLNKGIKLGFGSDAPVEDPNPLRSIMYAMSRERLDGQSFFKDESISFEQALNAFTHDAAFFSREENIKGKLDKGYLADFVIFEKPLESLAPEAFLTITPVATYVGGKCVYSR